MLVSFPAWEPHGMPGDNFVDYILASLQMDKL